MITAMLFVPVLLAFAVSSVDIGYLNTEKSRLQAVADMAVVSALGNVTWQGPAPAAEASEITSSINAFIEANGYDPTLFGEPTFENDEDGKHVVKVTLENQVPVRTFFWSAVKPGSDTLNVHIHSTAEVEYGSGGKELAPDFGLYARNKLDLQSAQVGLGTYDSTDSGWQEYYDLPCGAGDEIEIGNSTVFGDLYSTNIIDAGNTTIYGDVVMGDVDNSDLDEQNIFERVWEEGWDEQDIIDNSTTLNPPEEEVVPEVIMTQPTFSEIEQMDGYVEFNDLMDDQSDLQYKNGSISIKNKGTVTLEAGKVYWFPADFSTASQTTIKIVNNTGDPDAVCKIYTDSDFDASGQFEQNDTNLQLNSISTDENNRHECKFTVQSAMYMDIVAPNCDIVSRGSSGLKGRIYGYDVNVQSAFYFDKNLNSLGFYQDGAPSVTIRAHLTQ
jgi:hypothetical protein